MLKNNSRISFTSIRSDIEDDYWFRVLRICSQTNPSYFGCEFPSRAFKHFEYIDSGTYSHVIKAEAVNFNDVAIVFKIIKVLQKPILNKLSTLSFNGFELYADVYQEIVILSCLSNLHQVVCDQHGYEYQAHSYSKTYTTKIVYGDIPNYFLVRKFDENNPKAKAVERFEDLFGVPREHLAIIMKWCGESLWHLVNQQRPNPRYVGFHGGPGFGNGGIITADQLLSVCYQVTLALAVTEGLYEFEHRDLHVCNILVKPTKKDLVRFVIRSSTYRVKSYGVKACIIDATFSRIRIGDNTHFTDLSNRLKGTASNPNPDSQEVAYQKMYLRIVDAWRDWFPITNIFWLTYLFKEVLISDAFVADKCPHKDRITKNLQTLIQTISQYSSLIDFVSDMFEDSNNNKNNSQNKQEKKSQNSHGVRSSMSNFSRFISNNQH